MQVFVVSVSYASFVFLFSSSFTHDTQSTYKSKISHEILRNGCRRKNLMNKDDSCKKKKWRHSGKKSIWDRNFFHGYQT